MQILNRCLTKVNLWHVQPHEQPPLHPTTPHIFLWTTEKKTCVCRTILTFSFHVMSFFLNRYFPVLDCIYYKMKTASMASFDQLRHYAVHLIIWYVWTEELLLRGFFRLGVVEFSILKNPYLVIITICIVCLIRALV